MADEYLHPHVLRQNGDGVPQDNERRLSLVPTNIRFRDGSFSIFNNTDLDGNAGFNEIFPLFNWYVVETDSTRYKNTGYSRGLRRGRARRRLRRVRRRTATRRAEPPRSASSWRTRSKPISLPANLRFPGSVYCANADCTGFSIANGPGSSATANLSTGRIDPAWVDSDGWQGFIGQNSFLEFGKKPFAAGENGGIKGHVVYASTRPFDDPALLLQLAGSRRFRA